MQFPGMTRSGLSYQDASVEQWSAVLREAAMAGFDHVDLIDSWLRPGDLSPDRRDDLVRVLKDHGLGVTAISMVRKSVIDPDPDVSARKLAYTLRNVDAAAQIGTSVLCVGLHRPLTPAQQAALWFWTEQGETDPQDDDRMWALAVERLRAVGSYAAQVGINISLEMYEDTYLGTADSAIALVTDIDLPNVGLNPDIGNIIRLHRPIENWEDMHLKTLPHSNYWHIKNYFRDYDPGTGAYFSAPAPAKDGLISYRRALEIALDNGFSGPMCVEHYGGDGLSVAASNRDYLRRTLAVKLGH
jgi:sugar phosphate isomerase/epimerase